MRPALKNGLLPVWRNRDTIQIGIDPRRAIALSGMSEARSLLGLLDGSRDRVQIIDAAREAGIEPDLADRVITLLAAGGALHDFPATVYRGLSGGTRARLASELATAALAHGDSDGGARTLARRQGALVHVQGMSRAGLCIASVLAAAGVGQVVSTGHTAAQQDAADPPPAGQPPASQPPAGRRPGGWGPEQGQDRGADLVILADSSGRDLAEALLRRGIPHMAASASEAIGVVGPMVVPGRSACLRCLDLTRADRDPAWPLILAQATARTADPPACDTVLATAVAAQAVAQALAFIDRAAPPAAVTNGTLELFLPDWQWRRRTWRPHPRCGCGRRHMS